MEKDQIIKYRFGLVGKDISYSFSQRYFSEKFKELNLHDHVYQNIDISTIERFREIIESNNIFKGLNVTIPYKEAILPYLDEIDAEAKEIGAVNTIKFLKNNKLKGYNTDVYGFEKSIDPFIEKKHKKALILGTGGASKAVKYVLNKMGLEVLFVSRNPRNKNTITYKDLSKSTMKAHAVIVNCTPVGTHPAIDDCPDIPYKYLSEKHVLFDLIYNPSQTLFLKKGLQKNAQVSNGLKMLELQAEKSWKIWNS